MKSLFASKTFWANCVSLITTILVVSGHGLPAILATPEAQATAIAGITSVANIVLRTVTKEPVKVI
jgi:hypothetical protein